MSKNEYEKETSELLSSLIQDVQELIQTLGEENSARLFNAMNEIKEAAKESKENTVWKIEALVGSIVLSPKNYIRVLKITAKIAKFYAKFAKVSGVFVKNNIHLVL